MMPRRVPGWMLPAALAGLAFIFFFPLFILGRLGPFDFWWGLTLSVSALSGSAFLFDGRCRAGIRADILSRPVGKILRGIVSAAVLYLFFVGAGALAKNMFPLAGREIGRVYALKAGVSSSRILLSLLLVIGPGEEVFWRAFLQNRAQTHWGGRSGWLAASALYTAVHLGSGNPLLVGAAAIGGLFWGYLYLRYRSILLNAVSHTLWDVLIFLVRPIF